MTDNDKRSRGLETMASVYGWEVKDGPGDFFGLTVEHLFAEIWTRPGLTMRDRRLLLIGLLTGQGLHDVAEIQLGAALRNDEVDAAQLREIVIFLTHYAGWPSGAKLSMLAEQAITADAKARRNAAAAHGPAAESDAHPRTAKPSTAESGTAEPSTAGQEDAESPATH